MIACALVDLGLVLAPGLAVQDHSGRQTRAWPGLVVVLIVVFALAFAGQTGMAIVREALPHREIQP